MRYYVENLPRTCFYCDCCHTKPYDSRHKIDGEKFCGIENEDVEVYYYYGTGRPDWCPLKELPEKITTWEAGTNYQQGHRDGWNDCLKEILGE